MISLRSRLILWLVGAVLFVGSAAAVVAYVRVDRNAMQLMDRQLAQIASLIDARAQGLRSSAPRNDDDIEAATWTDDGALEYTSSELLKAPLATPGGFADSKLGDVSYRVFTVKRAGRTIQVAQPVDAREDQAEAAALGAFGPVLVLLPVLIVLIFVLVGAILRPIRAAAAAVSKRQVFSAETLSSSGLPKEIAPLIEELNRLLERQHQAVQHERDFIVDAAHALRTPIAALQLQADVLEGSPDPQERADRLLALKAGISRAARLSEQLLSVARIEADVGEVSGPVDLAGIFEEVHESHRTSVNAVSPGLVFTVPEPIHVGGNQRSVYLILSNLVENAVRYTRSQGVVRIEARAQGQSASIEVIDEGPGLPDEQLTRVFERFYRAPGDGRAGTGLGLSTVDGLVRQLGGRIRLRNRTDRSGLIAELQLPLWRPTDLGTA